MAYHAAREDSTTVTMRVGRKQKHAWMERAQKSGMSLTMYICYVMDRTDIVVSTMALDPNPASAGAKTEAQPRIISHSSRRTTSKSTSDRQVRARYPRATAK